MEDKIKSKVKITITLLWIIIIMRVIIALLSFSITSLPGLVIPIILLYWVKKKTLKAYETARIWATIFFLLVMYAGYESISTMDTASIVFYVIYICLMGAVALLINSICKGSESEVIETRTPENKKQSRKIIYILLAVLILTIIIAVSIS